jgi:hypothetical protein
VNLSEFNLPQRTALLDLAILAIYADSHLTVAEDERIHRLLAAMGSRDEHDAAVLYDAAVSRVSRVVANSQKAAEHALKLAQEFTTREQRQIVQEVLRDLIASDEKVAPQESVFLRKLREALGT